jgi:uncharacterized protein (TIGR02246 family)
MVMLVRWFTAAAVCLLATAGICAEPTAQTEDPVTAAAHDYLRAFAARDLEGCLAAFLPGKDTVMMGTGPGERWVGLKEISEAHKEMFKGFEKETFEPKWRVVTQQKKVAWVASEVSVKDTVDGREKEFTIHISTVWVLRKDRWQVALMHYSNLTGPEKSLAAQDAR